MYLVNWNPDQQMLEASLGGFVSPAEARVFADEVLNTIGEGIDVTYSVRIDYSRAKKLDEDAKAVLEALRESTVFCQASQITFVTPDEMEAQHHTDRRLQAVLEGREFYRAA